MNTSFNKKAQGGFTLIELIVVIVILGILAATALPKFASLSGDARMASLQAAKGAMSSASAMVHGKYLITNASPILVEGASIALVQGYPNAGSIGTAAGLTDDYDVTANGQTTTVKPKNLPNGLNNCFARYQEATATVPPVITVGAGPCE